MNMATAVVLISPVAAAQPDKGVRTPASDPPMTTFREVRRFKTLQKALQIRSFQFRMLWKAVVSRDLALKKKWLQTRRRDSLKTCLLLFTVCSNVMLCNSFRC